MALELRLPSIPHNNERVERGGSHRGEVVRDRQAAVLGGVRPPRLGEGCPAEARKSRTTGCARLEKVDLKLFENIKTKRRVKNP